MISLNMKLNRNKIKLSSRKCDLCCCCLTLLTPPAGWDILGYESDPFPYYRWLRTHSYPNISLEI